MIKKCLLCLQVSTCHQIIQCDWFETTNLTEKVLRNTPDWAWSSKSWLCPYSWRRCIFCTLCVAALNWSCSNFSLNKETKTRKYLHFRSVHLYQLETFCKLVIYHIPQNCFAKLHLFLFMVKPTTIKLYARLPSPNISVQINRWFRQQCPVTQGHQSALLQKTAGKS